MAFNHNVAGSTPAGGNFFCCEKIDKGTRCQIVFTMFTDSLTFLVTPISFIAYYGFVYFTLFSLIYSANLANLATVNNLLAATSTQKSLSIVSDPVLQADTVETVTSSENTFPQKESIVDSSNYDDSISPVKFDDTPVPYRHELWPSPRPVNFVKAILNEEPECNVGFQRLAHVNAVDILAKRASMTRREFLNTNPLIYSEKYMKGIAALYLLKGSIDRLEQMLRGDTTKQQFRLVNGRTVYSA